MNPQKLQLENGTRVVITPVKDIASATIMVLVKAGSRNESLTNNGVAHFIEHTFFKGSQKRPSSLKIAMDIELMGGYVNAFTSYEYTGYYIKVPKENLESAIEILSDMLLNPLFSLEEMNKERGVIIEEIRMYDDIPRERVRALFTKNVFKDNPLAQDIAGTVDSIADMHRDELLKFVERNYNSSNIVLSVAGPVDSNKVVDLLNKYFSNIQPGEQSSSEGMTRYDLNAETDIISDKTNQAHVLLGGFSYKRDTKEKYDIKVGNAIMSYGFGSKLFQVLREKYGLAYYVNSRSTSFSDIGLFTVSMGVNTKNAQSAVDETIKELIKLIRGDFSKEELDRARNYLVGSYTIDLEATDDIAQWYGIQELLSESIETLEDSKRKVASVTKDKIVDAWSEIVIPENMYMAAIGDFKGKLKINFY